jgi:hypothetical protein
MIEVALCIRRPFSAEEYYKHSGEGGTSLESWYG